MTYVDDGRAPLGRMRMAHMVADTPAELRRMAEALGLRGEWLQEGGTAREHYDVCQATRARAIRLGARAVGRRELVAILRGRR